MWGDKTSKVKLKGLSQIRSRSPPHVEIMKRTSPPHLSRTWRGHEDRHHTCRVDRMKRRRHHHHLSPKTKKVAGRRRPPPPLELIGKGSGES